MFPCVSTSRKYRAGDMSVNGISYEVLLSSDIAR